MADPVFDEIILPEQGVAGQIAPGNIDLSKRPAQFEGLEAFAPITVILDDGTNALIPTVFDGKGLSDEDAIAQYEATGKHMGIFETAENVTEYENNLHESLVQEGEFYAKYPEADEDDFTDYLKDKEGWLRGQAEGEENAKREALVMEEAQQAYTDPEPNPAYRQYTGPQPSYEPPSPNTSPTEPFNFKQRYWRFVDGKATASQPDKFDEVILPATSGQFEEIVLPKKPSTETEKALAETPIYNPKNEQIRAAPTFFGELHAGRLGSAYHLAKEMVGNAFAGQPIEKGRGQGLLGTEERLEDAVINPDDSPEIASAKSLYNSTPLRAARAFINVANRTMAGLTTPGMIPLAVIGGGGGTAGKLVAGAFAGDIALHAPETWAAIQEADKTEPMSLERFETGMDTVMQGLMLHGTARHALKKTPVTPQESSEAPPATTERPVEQTQSSVTADVRDVPPEARPEQRMVPIAELPPTEPKPSSGERGGLITKRFGELYRDEKGAIDAPAFSEGVRRSVKEALERGQEVELISDLHINQPQVTPIVDVRGGGLMDGKNQPWGTVDILTGAAEIRIKPKARAEPIGVTETISELERRNARSTEPVIPNEPAGTKFPEPEANAAESIRDTIPENVRRDPEIDRLINDEAAQTGPQMKMDPATEGGALGFGGGKRATVQPKGTTPRGDIEFLRIEPGIKRVFKGLERKGAADVLGETKNRVGKLLSEATRKHVDIEQELFGRMSSELTKPVRSVSKQVANQAFDEVAGYFAAKENGRPLPTISPTAQKLVTAWEHVAEKTGQIAQANNVQVFDPATGASRPMHVIGSKYVPRMFKAEVEQVMRDPNSNPKIWNDLVADLATQRGIPEVDAANALRKEAGKFSSNDFMGNLEMARTGKMPESFYEYDLRNLAARYIPNFSERMAQIISYGQRLGPREQPTRPNLWDVARKEAGDTYTQDWLTSAESQSVNLKQKGTAAVAMARAQTAASGLLLSSPTTTVLRNLISGVSATPELLGVRRSLKGIAKTIVSRQARMDAREIGTVRDNIADFLHADRLGDSPVDNAIRSVVDAGLKYSGYNGSEVFVRTHGTVTAAQFAKDAVAALAKKPTSMRSKEALGLFKRMGVDAAKIVAEKADWKSGPETRKFIRTVVRDTQGGYRFDQVPLWANSNMGRFFYQFGRWGTQRARNIWKNGIKPALGEEVQWHGKTMTRRDIRPLVKMLAGTVVLGETFAGIAQFLFGRDRPDASVAEISAAWNEDEKKAVGLAMQRVMNDVIMAGTLGIWSQPIDWAKSLSGQTRLKNPMEPPGLGSLRAFAELGQNMIDQGGEVTRRDLWKFTGTLVPGVKQMGDVARNVMDEPLYEAENDVRTLRSAAHRWADSSGLDVSRKAKGDFRKSPMAPEYEPIKEALLVGDVQRASFLKKAFLDKQPNRKQAAKNLKASIQMSQPFRAGPYTAEVHRDNFYEWAKKNLNADDLNQAQRIQSRYKKAAVAAELW